MPCMHHHHHHLPLFLGHYHILDHDHDCYQKLHLQRLHGILVSEIVTSKYDPDRLD